jgi:Chorismate synthase
MDIPVGALLKEWQSIVTTISRNIMELSEQTDVKIIKLKVKDNINGYTGLTKTKAAKAVEDLDTLWRYYALLSGVVDKAADLYSKDSFLKDTEADVRKMLESTLITLETEHVDINNRKLLQSENKYKKVGMKELLSLMQESFEATRNAFNEISGASETIKNRLSEIKDEINNLKSTASRLGLSAGPQFDTGRIANIESDPLQGLLEIDALSNSMEGYRASVRLTEKDYNETVDALNQASEMLSEMEDLIDKAKNAGAESQKIFTSVRNVELGLGEDVLKSLKDWLSILKSKLAEGSLNAAKIGAQRLKQECSSKLEIEKENYNDISRDYNEWLDLKGEFKALLAKLGALRVRGLLYDNSIDLLTEDLQESLYAEKVNLCRCRELIQKFRLSLKG